MYPVLNKLTDWIPQKSMVSGFDWLPKNWQLKLWLDFVIKGRMKAIFGYTWERKMKVNLQVFMVLKCGFGKYLRLEMFV